VTTFTQAASAFVIAIIGPLAPLLQSDFGISRAQVGLMQSAVYVSATFCSLVGGRLADSLGERFVLILSGAITGAAALLFAGVGVFPTAILTGFVLGLGTGMQHPAGSVAIMRWFPIRWRGFAMGIRQTGVPVGGVLSATLAPIVALTWGWRGAYVLAGAFALTGTALILLTYWDPKRETGPGAAPMRAMRDIMRDRTLALIALVYNAQVAAQYAVTVYFVLFLHEALGLSLVAASSVLAVVNVAAIGARMGWGFVSDAVFGGARKPVLLIIIALTFVSVLTAALLPRETPMPVIVLVALMLGATAYSWTGIYTALTVEVSGAASAATAIAWVHVLGGFGSFGGAPLFGLLVDRTGSYRVAWLLVAAVVTTGFVAAWRVREPLRM
jgi:sugar phosphate permease